MRYRRLLVTGDVHGSPVDRFSDENMESMGHDPLDGNDAVIVLGDCGVPFGVRKPDYLERWHDKDLETLKWMEEKGSAFVFICGNHDDRDFVNGLPVVEEADDPAIRQMVFDGHVYENISYICKPTTIEMCGKRLFVVPGAESHDILGGTPDPESDDFEDQLFEAGLTGRPYRIKHWSWWEDESIDIAEALEVEDWIRTGDEHIDYVLAHDCPADYAKRMWYEPNAGEYYLQHVVRDMHFDMLLHGHMHEDEVYGNGRCACMFLHVVDLLRDDPFGIGEREW